MNTIRIEIDKVDGGYQPVERTRNEAGEIVEELRYEVKSTLKAAEALAEAGERSFQKFRVPNPKPQVNESTEAE